MGSAVGRPGVIRRLFGRKGGRTPTVQSTRATQPPLADPAIHEAHNPLLTRLKDVYVDSTSTTITQDNPFASEVVAKKPTNLPQDRTAHTRDVFSIDRSSDGRLTYPEVLDILNKRETEDTETWTPEAVSRRYGIEPADAENLMKYFSAYKLSSSSEK